MNDKELMTEVADFLEARIDKIGNLKEYHCFDMITEILTNCPVRAIHYTVNGCRAEVMWTDGQRYEVVINPIKDEP